MSMALLRVCLYTHEGYRMLKSVKETVEILFNIMSNDVLIVPLPDNIPRSGFYGFGANISWHSKLWDVNINHVALFDSLL